jgi:hypothetical protein
MEISARARVWAQAILPLIMTVVRKLKPPHKTVARAQDSRAGDIFAMPRFLAQRVPKYLGGKIVCLCTHYVCVYTERTQPKECALFNVLNSKSGQSSVFIAQQFIWPKNQRWRQLMTFLV